jgi:hypothetical protein
VSIGYTQTPGIQPMRDPARLLPVFYEPEEKEPAVS